MTSDNCHTAYLVANTLMSWPPWSHDLLFYLHHLLPPFCQNKCYALDTPDNAPNLSMTSHSIHSIKFLLNKGIFTRLMISLNDHYPVHTMRLLPSKTMWTGLYFVCVWMLLFFVFEPHLMVLGGSFGSALRYHSWQGSGEHMDCLGEIQAYCMQGKHPTLCTMSPLTVNISFSLRMRHPGLCPFIKCGNLSKTVDPYSRISVIWSTDTL